MPVALVRNHAPGPTVLSIKALNFEGEWQRAGDPGMGDLQEVPEDVLDTVHFRRVVQRGILSVEQASEDALARLNDRGARWAAAQEEEQRKHLSVLDQTKADDIISIPCMGPDTRGVGQCGADVPVREKERSARPPLCINHQHLAHQFAYVETGEVKDGKAVHAWARGTMGNPLPSQAAAASAVEGARTPVWSPGPAGS